MSDQVGTITWISGPVVRARGSRNVGMLELVEVGAERLVGEVIGLEGDQITVQVYEETAGSDSVISSSAGDIRAISSSNPSRAWCSLTRNSPVEMSR